MDGKGDGFKISFLLYSSLQRKAEMVVKIKMPTTINMAMSFLISLTTF